MKKSVLDKHGVTSETKELLERIVASVPWPERREAMGDVALTVLDGKARVAESTFGWNRNAVELGMNELRTGITCLNDLSTRRRPKTEEKDPELLADIRRFIDPHTQADPQLRTNLSYTNITAKAVYDSLREMGRSPEELPTVRTISNLLNRHGYRLRSVAKTKVQKKRRKPTRSLKMSAEKTPLPTPVRRH